MIRLIVEETGVKYVDAKGDDQGFLASDGLYWRRADALRIARECGQLRPGGTGERLGELYSEDVW